MTLETESCSNNSCRVFVFTRLLVCKLEGLSLSKEFLGAIFKTAKREKNPTDLGKMSCKSKTKQFDFMLIQTQKTFSAVLHDTVSDTSDSDFNDWTDYLGSSGAVHASEY